MDDLLLGATQGSGFGRQGPECGGQVRARLFDGEIWSNAHDKVPGHFGSVPEPDGRHPCFGGPWIVEVHGRDTDDGKRVLLDSDGPAYRRCCASEQALGQTGREHHDVRRTNLVVGGSQQATGASAHAEHVEPFAGHGRALHRHGRPVVEMEDGCQHTGVGMGAHSAGRPETLAHALVPGVRERPVRECAFGFGGPDDEQPLLSLDGEWLEQDAIDDAEDARRRADCQRQREHGRHRYDRRHSQCAYAVTNVLNPSLHEALPSLESRPGSRSTGPSAKCPCAANLACWVNGCSAGRSHERTLV